VIPDPRLAAIIDRVTFNAHIIETGTESYRLLITKGFAARRKTGLSYRSIPFSVSQSTGGSLSIIRLRHVGSLHARSTSMSPCSNS
jgi:hypothetical protein